MQWEWWRAQCNRCSGGCGCVGHQGVLCSGSGGEDNALGVLGYLVVLGTKGSEGHLSCPACEGVSLGSCVQF